MNIDENVIIPALAAQEKGFTLSFPDQTNELEQDAEWCNVRVGDQDWQRIRFHDYDRIYNIPGLYESLFYRTLRCNSPVRIVSLLQEVMRDHKQSLESLRVLDVGAGNGMVGAALHDVGVRSVTGIDIIPEAKDAAQRDRPWAYDNYYIADLTDLDESIEKQLRQPRFNAMTSVAALGYGDIPSRAFVTALDLIETGGWLAFNIKEDFIQHRHQAGFGALMESLGQLDVIRFEAYRRYRHRYSRTGEPLYYVAVVATKQAEIPDEFHDFTTME